MSGLRMPPLRPVLRGRALPWALAALMLGSTVALLFLWRAERAEEARRQEVAAAARTFLRALTTFEAATIERDVEEIRSHATGRFAEEVDRTFSPRRIDEIREARVESAGSVRQLVVVSVDGTDADVFAVVDETVRNEADPGGRRDVLRVALGMIETAEGWRVAEVEVLPTPGDIAPPG